MTERTAPFIRKYRRPRVRTILSWVHGCEGNGGVGEWSELYAEMLNHHDIWHPVTDPLPDSPSIKLLKQAEALLERDGYQGGY